MKKIIIFLCLSLIVLFIVSLTLGKYPITLFDLYEYGLYKLFSIDSLDMDKTRLIDNIIINIRLPRIIAAILIGASYAISGASFQAMFINPLVSPGILGVLSGAAFGAALSIAFFDNWYITQILSFSFGVIAVLFSISITYIYKDKSNSTLILILGGIISGSFFSTLLSIVKYTADPYDKLPSIVYWLMGSLSFVEIDEILLFIIPMLLSISGLILMSKYLNVLSFGDQEAQSLGVNTKLIRVIVIVLATFVCALSVSIGGMIGWIGLIIPHFARLIVGPNNSILLIVSALMGALFLLIVDNASRLILDVEIPIGILTSLIGIPIFIIALKNSKKGLH